MTAKIIRKTQERRLTHETPAPTLNLMALADHVGKCLGADFFVLHEVASSVIHLDVYVVKPSKDLPFWTLVTSGMSDLAMAVPERIDSPKHIELAMCLPPEWPLSLTEDQWKDERFFWPIRGLKSTAMYPHLYKTWLGPGHSIQLGENELAGGRFAGYLVHRLRKLPEGFACCEGESGTIEIFGFIPLLPEEMAYKLGHGLKSLLDRLDSAGINELLDPARSAASPIQ